MYLGFKHYIKRLMNMKDCPPMKWISTKLCLKCTSFGEKKKVLNMEKSPNTTEFNSEISFTGNKYELFNVSYVRYLE